MGISETRDPASGTRMWPFTTDGVATLDPLGPHPDSRDPSMRAGAGSGDGFHPPLGGGGSRGGPDLTPDGRPHLMAVDSTTWWDAAFSAPSVGWLGAGPGGTDRATGPESGER